MPDEALARRPRAGRLLVPVTGVSGKTYPVGTEVSINGGGPAVDGFVSGDWIPLHWWEFAETTREVV